MFKIGQKIVLARPDKWHVPHLMDGFLGKEYTIREIKKHTISLDGNRYLFDGTGFNIIKEAIAKKKIVKKEKTYKFNIGDRVKVVKAKVEGQAFGFNEKMLKSEGKIFTIYYQSDNIFAYRFKESKEFTWDERCLKRVRKAVAIAPENDLKDVKPLAPKDAIIAAPMPVPEAPKAIVDPVKKKENKNPTLQEELREKTNNHPGTCSYAKEYKDGTRVFHIADVCHARISDGSDKKIVKLALDIQGHSGNMGYKKQSYHDYVNYIINYSPWAPIFHSKGLDNALKYGILLNVEKPIYQCFGAAVVLREGSEFSQKLSLFSLLLAKGYSGNTAYLLSAAITGTEGTFKFKGLDNQHKVLSGEQDAKDLFEFFKNGYVRKEGEKSYSTHHRTPYGIAKFIAKCAESRLEEINNVLRRALGIKENKDWDAKLDVPDAVLFSYAKQLDTLLNK